MVDRLKNYILNNKYIIIIFIVLFIFGIQFIGKINANFDENLEQNILLGNVKDYVEALKLEGLINKLNNYGIISISVSSEKDHGMAPYYLFAPLLMLRQYSMHLTSILWHVYTYLIFFIGVIYLYKLINYLFNSRKVSIIASFMYFLSPRILIDSLHNNKDIVIMSLLIIMIYYGLKFIKEKKYKYAVLFALVSAFVSNIKILGLFFLFIFGMGYIINLIIEKKWNKQNFLCGLLAAVLSIIFFVILTPAIWGDGSFKIIDYVNYCLTNSVNFRGSVRVLFEGIRYNHDSNPLPWYYLPKMMIITLPIMTSLLFIGAVIVFLINLIKSIFNKKIEFVDYSYLLLFLIFLVPFMIAITSNPNVYNGWRHFYFLNGLLILFVAYIIYYIFNKYDKLKKIILFFIIVNLSFNVFYLLKYNIANTSYYNILVGRKDLSKKYELDYYNITSVEAIKKFMKSDNYEKNEDGLIYLYGSGFNNRILTDICTNSKGDFKNKIIIVTNNDLNKYLSEGKIVYSLNNPVYTYEDMTNYENVYTYKMFNNRIIDFYKMN